MARRCRLPLALLFCAAFGLLAATPGLAQQKGQISKDAPAKGQAGQNPPAAVTVPQLPEYQLKGFRAAAFGMDEQAVRKAINADFNVKESAVKVEDSPVDRTRVLVVSLPKLEPGPGPAVVSYILGFSSKRLIQVNVVWSGEKNEKSQAPSIQPLYAAGVSLGSHFLKYSWKEHGLRKDLLVDKTAILMFQGESKSSKGLVEVFLGNVPVTLKEPDKTETALGQPDGPAFLRVSYVANREEPDVYRVKAGEF